MECYKKEKKEITINFLKSLEKSDLKDTNSLLEKINKTKDSFDDSSCFVKLITLFIEEVKEKNKIDIEEAKDINLGDIFATLLFSIRIFTSLKYEEIFEYLSISIKEITDLDYLINLFLRNDKKNHMTVLIITKIFEELIDRDKLNEDDIIEKMFKKDYFFSIIFYEKIAYSEQTENNDMYKTINNNVINIIIDSYKNKINNSNTKEQFKISCYTDTFLHTLEENIKNSITKNTIQKLINIIPNNNMNYFNFSKYIKEEDIEIAYLIISKLEITYKGEPEPVRPKLKELIEYINVKDIAKDALKDSGFYFQYLPYWLQKDEDLAMIAIDSKTYVLKYILDVRMPTGKYRYRNTDFLVKIITNQKINSLKYEIIQDTNISYDETDIEVLISNSPYIYNVFSNEEKENIEAIYLGLSKYKDTKLKPYNEYASRNEIYKDFVSQNTEYFKLFNEVLSDIPFIKQILSNIGFNKLNYSEKTLYGLEGIPEELLDNGEFIYEYLSALIKSGLDYEFLRTNNDFIWEHLSDNIIDEMNTSSHNTIVEVIKEWMTNKDKEKLKSIVANDDEITIGDLRKAIIKKSYFKATKKQYLRIYFYEKYTMHIELIDRKTKKVLEKCDLPMYSRCDEFQEEYIIDDGCLEFYFEDFIMHSLTKAYDVFYREMELEKVLKFMSIKLLSPDIQSYGKTKEKIIDVMEEDTDAKSDFWYDIEDYYKKTMNFNSQLNILKEVDKGNRFLKLNSASSFVNIFDMKMIKDLKLDDSNKWNNYLTLVEYLKEPGYENIPLSKLF